MKFLKKFEGYNKPMKNIETRDEETINLTDTNESAKINDNTVNELLSAIDKIEKIFDDEYIPKLYRLVKNDEIDERLIDHADTVSNDFAALRNWAKENYFKRTK
jgi:hypothetical protein